MVVWSFVDFGSGEFRLARVEGSEDGGRVALDLAAERPWSSLAEALRPWGLTPAEVAWEAALVRQRRERGEG